MIGLKNVSRRKEGEKAVVAGWRAYEAENTATSAKKEGQENEMGKPPRDPDHIMTATIAL